MSERTKKLNLNLHQLEIIRERHFGLEDYDSSRDSEIENMTNEEIVKCIIGWDIDEDWVDEILKIVSSVTQKSFDEVKTALYDE